ncbi:MAG TPA: serine hydrolase domain-containing protein [Ktedonobacterales bacterium]|nr:serine hydrolase domain-containing protein [Ktedonobacterales bacterium]
MRLDEIDAIVNARIGAQDPGVAVAVTHGGQLIHCQGYGMAQLEWSQAISPNTVFGIGSITKPFTATAILLLRAEGKLRLDDDITAHLPDYDMHSETITIAHLLTHTSGIPNFVTLPGFWESGIAHDHSHAEIRARFERLPLRFAPGERYSYNNSAYCLLGMLIETLSGMPYGEFIRERIFEPLGMRDSHYLAPRAVIPRRAEGYAATASGYERARYMSATLQYSAGALGSTAEDLARWDLALRNGRLLDHQTQAEMQAPTRLASGRTVGYGMGWGIRGYRGRRAIGHAGGVPGYSAFYGRFPDEDLSIIVLSNRALFDAAGLAEPIAALLLDLHTPQHEPVALPSEAMARMTGTYASVTGDALEISLRDRGLHVSGEMTCDLIPLSATTFVSATDPDRQVHFADEGPAGFERVTVTVPFYWYEVMRTRG